MLKIKPAESQTQRKTLNENSKKWNLSYFLKLKILNILLIAFEISKCA